MFDMVSFVNRLFKYSISIFLLLINLPVINISMADPTESPVERLRKLSRVAEVISQDISKVREQLDRIKQEQQNLQFKLEKNQKIITRTSNAINALKPDINKYILVNYKGGKINSVYSVLFSLSPKQVLDQMSILDIVSSDIKIKLHKLISAKKKLFEVNRRVVKLNQDKNLLKQRVEKKLENLEVKQLDLDSKILDIKTTYGMLNNFERRNYIGPDYSKLISKLPKKVGLATIIVNAALSQIGKPYVWGGNSPATGFDCSGLIQWAFSKAGILISRTSQAQTAGGVPVSRSQLQPGDIVAYYNDASHVALYIGNGMVVHAVTFGIPVKVVPLDNPGAYLTARRYI